MCWVHAESQVGFRVAISGMQMLPFVIQSPDPAVYLTCRRVMKPMAYNFQIPQALNSQRR
jgi:hypothetical protein